MKRREEWGPPWNPLVRGSYDVPRTFDADGMPEEQVVECWCLHAACKGRPRPHYRRPCTSGNVRQVIAKFAAVHVHDDPFEARKPDAR